MKNTQILILIIVSIFLGQNAFCGEADNYLAWGHDIEDEYRPFNDFLNSEVQARLDLLNGLDELSKVHIKTCRKAAKSVMYELGTNVLGLAALNAKFELWAQENPEIDSYPANTTTNREMRKISIYGPKPNWKERWFLSIDRIVNVGGIYFGTDKLSHFAASGYLYYKNYLKALKKGKSKLDAIKFAIKEGHLMEGGIIGIKSTGVFAYADMEANFQGMLMAIDMCEGENPYLYKKGNDWHMASRIDFRDYVNPYWDESYNVSGFTPDRVKRLLPMIKKNAYCDKLESEWIRDQRGLYEEYKESQQARLKDRSRLIQYPIDTIKKMESRDREMKKLLRKNKIYHQDSYKLEKLCTLIQ